MSGRTAHDVAILHCHRIGMTAEEIAEDLELPLDLVVRRLVIRGRSRRGYVPGCDPHPSRAPAALQAIWTQHGAGIVAGLRAGVARTQLCVDLGRVPVDLIVRAARRGQIDAPDLLEVLRERGRRDGRVLEGRGCRAPTSASAGTTDGGAKID